MKIKKGDKVIVVSGAEKGKTGTVTRALPKTSQVLIEGVNLRKKHEKSRQGGRQGQIVERATPLHVSNVMLLDPKSGKGTRVSIKRDNGKRARIAVKSKQEV